MRKHIKRFFEVFDELPGEDYDKLLYCHKCGETNKNWIERFDDIKNSFITARCLSCGSFISLAKNLERKEKSGSIVIMVNKEK